MLQNGKAENGSQHSVKQDPKHKCWGKKGRAVRRVYGKAVQRTNCTAGMEKGSLGFSQLWKFISLLRAQILGFGQGDGGANLDLRRE